MATQDIIQHFSTIINQGLVDGLDQSPQAQLALSDQDTEIVSKLLEAFHHAYKPSVFFNHRVMHPDSYFEQCYQLMCNVFEPDVIDSKDGMIASFGTGFVDSSPSIKIGRFWETMGACRYSEDGQLEFFHYDPLSITRHIAAMISGSFMALDEGVDGMAGVGQLATRPYLRQQGHGAELARAFEATAHQIAELRGKIVKLIVLESETRARPFWTKMGFRYPKDSRYMQPPIDFNLETGDPIYPPVPEMLMVKRMDDPDAKAIASDFLVHAVRVLYKRWYVPSEASQSVMQRITDLVYGELFAQFEESVRQNGASTPLINLLEI